MSSESYGLTSHGLGIVKIVERVCLTDIRNLAYMKLPSPQSLKET